MQKKPRRIIVGWRKRRNYWLTKKADLRSLNINDHGNFEQEFRSSPTESTVSLFSCKSISIVKPVCKVQPGTSIVVCWNRLPYQNQLYPSSKILPKIESSFPVIPSNTSTSSQLTAISIDPISPLYAPYILLTTHYFLQRFINDLGWQDWTICSSSRCPSPRCTLFSRYNCPLLLFCNLNHWSGC